MKKLNALAKDAKINEHASIRDQHSIVINAPIDKVWNKLIDLPNWHEWNPTISKVKLEGEITEQSTFSWLLDGHNHKSQIQSIKEPSILSWTGISKNVKRIYVWELVSDDNQTIVTISTSLQGIFIVLESHQKIFKELQSWLDYLKEEAEKD